MKKEVALDILKQYKLQKQNDYGISKIGIFGSTAKDTARDNSDIDVVIQIENPDLFLLSRIRQEIEERAKVHVDLVRLRDKMNSFLKAQIQKDAIYV